MHTCTHVHLCHDLIRSIAAIANSEVVTESRG